MNPKEFTNAGNEVLFRLCRGLEEAVAELVVEYAQQRGRAQATSEDVVQAFCRLACAQERKSRRWWSSWCRR